MDRPVPEIDHELGMADGPRGVARVAGRVSRVGAGGGVSPSERRGHRGVANRSRVGAVADTLKLPVPGRQRQPYLEIHGGPGDTRHTAECGQVIERRGARRSKRRPGDFHGRFDRRVRQGDRGEAGAGLLRAPRHRRRREGGRQQQCRHRGRDETSFHGASFLGSRVFRTRSRPVTVHTRRVPRALSR